MGSLLKTPILRQSSLNTSRFSDGYSQARWIENDYGLNANRRHAAGKTLKQIHLYIWCDALKQIHN